MTQDFPIDIKFSRLKLKPIIVSFVEYVCDSMWHPRKENFLGAWHVLENFRFDSLLTSSWLQDWAMSFDFPYRLSFVNLP